MKISPSPTRLAQTSRIATIAALTAAAACHQQDPAPPPPEAPPAKVSAGRDDTKSIQALDLSGYDSKPIRKSVDKTLDAAEKRDKDLQKALEPE